MGPVRLGVGAEWLLDERAYRVVRQPAADRFVARDLKFQTEQEFTEQQLLRLYTSGRLRFAAEPGSPSPTPPADPPRSLPELSPHEQESIEQRWRAVEPLTRLGHPPTGDDYRRRAEELRRLGTPVSERSLRRYWSAWSKSRGDRMALLPKVAGRGHRGRPRRNGILSRFPVLRQLVDEAIRGVYLTTARRPISAVVRRVLEDLQRRNARLPAGQAVPVPRESALSRAVSRRIARLDPWEVDRARWGRRIADRRHAATSAQRLATRILERVEIDHSPLKVVVGGEAGPIGQPWLTVLIDYYSRMILGFCLGFEPPSCGVLMEALRHAILPKSGLRERYPRVQGDWPCYGLPSKLVCDRGADLTSRDFEQAAFQLGIELDFAPPRTPHLKGTVESFFDVLNDQLLASLPGRTFRGWERRADYDPDRGPLLPYEALLEILHIHLVDVYAAGRHPTAPKSRRETWQESAAEYPPGLPASPDELAVLLARRAERTLSTRGVELGGMFYTSDELLALRAELAAHNLGGDRLQVRYNPWDLGAAWVLNPITRAYFRVPAADPAMAGLTEYQWRVLKRAVRERFDEPEHLLSLAAGRNAIREVVEAAVRTPSRRRRVRAARFLQKPSREVPDDPALSGEGWVDVPPSPGAPAPHVAPEAGPPPPPGGADTVSAEPSPEAAAEPPPAIDPDALDVDDWDVAC